MPFRFSLEKCQGKSTVYLASCPISIKRKGSEARTEFQVKFVIRETSCDFKFSRACKESANGEAHWIIEKTFKKFWLVICTYQRLETEAHHKIGLERKKI